MFLGEQLWRETMAEMARISCEAYRAVVREDERFVNFFQSITPGAHAWLPPCCCGTLANFARLQCPVLRCFVSKVPKKSAPLRRCSE